MLPPTLNVTDAPPKGNKLAKIIHPLSAAFMLIQATCVCFFRLVPCPRTSCPFFDIYFVWFTYVAFLAVIVLFSSVFINVKESKMGILKTPPSLVSWVDFSGSSTSSCSSSLIQT